MTNYLAFFNKLGIFVSPNLIVNFFCLRLFAYNYYSILSIYDWLPLFPLYIVELYMNSSVT